MHSLMTEAAATPTPIYLCTHSVPDYMLMMLSFVTHSRAILSNPDVQWSTPVTSLMLNDFWGVRLTSAGSHKSYRPITVLSFRVNYYLHQLQPMGYHLANIVLHAITSGLFTQFAGQVFHGQVRPTLTAGLIFASHPIHCESVASIVGRADVGSGLFFLLSLICYMMFCDSRDDPTAGRRVGSYYLYSCLIFACLAMLTKETGISKCHVCFWTSFPF